MQDEQEMERGIKEDALRLSEKEGVTAASENCDNLWSKSTRRSA